LPQRVGRNSAAYSATSKHRRRNTLRYCALGPERLARPHFLDFSFAEARFRATCGTAAPSPRNAAMAKANMIKIKLLSSADTGYFYVTKKNSRTKTDKLVKKKYDPIAKKHVEFRETKIK
jgi:large subunit ribosomal protein L33